MFVRGGLVENRHEFVIKIFTPPKFTNRRSKLATKAAGVVWKLWELFPVMQRSKCLKQKFINVFWQTVWAMRCGENLEDHTL